MKMFHIYNRSILLLMTALFIGAGFLYFITVRMVLIHELDEALDDTRGRIEAHTAAHGRLPVPDGIDDTYFTFKPATQQNPARYELVRTGLPGQEKKHRYRELHFSMTTASGIMEVTVARPLEGIHLLTTLIVSVTLALLLAVIVTGLLLNRRLLHRLWKPFYDTLGRLEHFNIREGAPPTFTRTDIREFQLLNERLGKTIGDAQQEYLTLKEFTENAAHELQTPLAIIRSKLDLVIQQEGLSATQTDALQSAYAGIRRLDKLNRSLLLLAKIENRQFSEQTPMRLDLRIKDKLRQLEELIAESGITVTSHLQEATLHCNETLLDVLLNNLFSNAVRHNIRGGVITVALDGRQLRIANTGAAGALDGEKLFRRFYRGSQHTTRHGLGLAIIKEIVQQSGMHIAYEWQDGSHSFVLTW